METKLPAELIATERGREADRILRSCVHCGFCNATCPTYQLTGDELDGPRGRIYLIKSALEAGEASAVTRRHLDRCLTCRSCETTCPSGVEYGKLLDIGREFVEETAPHSPMERFARGVLTEVVTEAPTRLRALALLGESAAWALPNALASKMPRRQENLDWPEVRHARRVLLYTGCAQRALTPATNVAIARLLDRIGVSVHPADGCCGAMEWHLSDVESARDRMRSNVRRWSESMSGAEAMISTASGCGVHLKDYGRLLGDDHATAMAAATLDIAEFLERERHQPKAVQTPLKVAWHSPCTLQHGQRIRNVVESLLTQVGHRVVTPRDPHLCCGSAGTYSVLQPRMATQLRDAKLNALQEDAPDVIATANVGCQLHLQTGTELAVKHWVELLL